MLNFGESRLIGSPQWSNVSRTFDTGQFYYRTENVRFEVLMVSPVKVLSGLLQCAGSGGEDLGNLQYFRAYVAWHFGGRVRPAAFAEQDWRLDRGGHSRDRHFRWTGLWAAAGQVCVQRGDNRPDRSRWPAAERAHAGFAGMSRRATLFGKPLDMSAEYKLASGTRHADPNSGTFDQLSPANHDKFGQEDLFGWRNLRT